MSKMIKKGMSLILLGTSLIFLGGCETLDSIADVAYENSSLFRRMSFELTEQLIDKDKKPRKATKTISVYPDYTGEEFAIVGDGRSTFTEKELLDAEEKGLWVEYGELDHLNRATTMNAVLGPKNIRTGSDANSSIHPTGWNKQNQEPNNPKRTDRGHLLAKVLGGSGDDWRNLMTLYRRANHPSMYNNAEKIVQYAIEDTGAYVRYRVTPIFEGEELMAKGVLIMAKSINNDSVDFKVFIFNEP